MRLPLDSPLVKGQSRYAPDVAGYNNLVKRIAQLYRDARAVGLAWVPQPPQETAGPRPTASFEVALEPLLLDGDVRRMTVTFDTTSSLMTHTLVYDAKDQLVEDYDWQNLRLNVGLTDADFRFETER